MLLGDPGRAYLPHASLTEKADYQVPTNGELKDRDRREAVVWHVARE